MAIQRTYDKVKESKYGRMDIFKFMMIQETEKPHNMMRDL